MTDFTKSELLSFLYSEKDRIQSNNSRPGWSNWAIAGSFVAVGIYLFDILKEPSLLINWEIVLMLFISLFSLAIILIMAYPQIFPKVEIYYPNRITTLWEEVPIFEYVISGFSFSSIFILLLINGNHSWVLYVMGYLSLERIICLCFYFYKRNELVPSGIRFNIIPNNGIVGKSIKIISFVLFASIVAYSSFNIIADIKLYLNELQVAICIVVFWILTYIFFKTNLAPNRMANYLDNIIEKVAYSNMSEQEAMEELMFFRYGGGIKQIIKNDLNTYFSSITKLNDTNTILDNIIKEINEGRLNPETYINWSKYINSELPKLREANRLGSKIIEKINKIYRLPNSAKSSSEFGELLELTKSGIDKVTSAVEKFTKIRGSLDTFSAKYGCRKLGRFCDKLECEKRNDKMSFNYACEVYPFKYAIKRFIFRKL